MSTPTKKKRKIFKKLFLLLFGSILMFILAMENLNTYSIYYEEQLATSEKERRDNIIKATIINLRSLNYEDIPNMRFDFDGINFVENQNDSTTGHYPSVSEHAGGYTYFDKNGFSYSFDNNLNLRYGVNSAEQTILDSTQLNEEQLKNEMYETIRPVIKAQNEPGSFNLLWLYKLLKKYSL
ncbi:hypothetical protein BVE84_06255 [Streptococcus azizii]|uniref:Two-component sensor histidine kinase n=2 Tax=Streptococcus TaxID=1301 RepID=A0AB36JPZ3_9STRE|nr:MULTISPECIES: hypothetical protein [Streptococcus]MBF0776192.1 hypothetical protein [Streptococcus sp. 19428wD3_AN2]ONK26964.1 hypothetical protein BVE86_06450 [Streptococcus azizii]ONK27986.1 hypothetical protein BVE85_05805 [Streptococcus azizii]ONK28830.1 hypothetical protein BVE84_06255 [Streptococcus azizii]TFU83535.1 hypothetical protein E4T83_05310 [Streptococcus sp. AN2]